MKFSGRYPSVIANDSGKKIFKIPVTWQMMDFIEVQATTLEEALNYANENSDDIPLGTLEAVYIDGSYEIGSFEDAELYLDEAKDF